MSRPITSQILPELLAREELSYSVRVPIAQFKRLSNLLHSAEGDFTAEVVFSKWGKHVKATGQFQVDLSLICQRCLKPMTHKVDTSFELICVDDEEQAEALDEQYDPVIMDEDREIKIEGLFEDEIILQLPTVARHEGDEECTISKTEFGKLPDNIPSEKPKPFAALKDLKLKH